MRNCKTCHTLLPHDGYCVNGCTERAQAVREYEESRFRNEVVESLRRIAENRSVIGELLCTFRFAVGQVAFCARRIWPHLIKNRTLKGIVIEPCRKPLWGIVKIEDSAYIMPLPFLGFRVYRKKEWFDKFKIQRVGTGQWKL